MKLNTRVFARFESKGQPESSKDFEGPIREFVPEIAKWLLDVQMGSHLQVTVCRNEEDLNQKTGRAGVKTKKQSEVDEMFADFEALGFLPDEPPLPHLTRDQ